jgi:hypothetical protein
LPHFRVRQRSRALAEDDAAVLGEGEAVLLGAEVDALDVDGVEFEGVEGDDGLEVSGSAPERAREERGDRESRQGVCL